MPPSARGVELGIYGAKPAVQGSRNTQPRMLCVSETLASRSSAAPEVLCLSLNQFTAHCVSKMLSTRPPDSLWLRQRLK